MNQKSEKCRIDRLDQLNEIAAQLNGVSQILDLMQTACEAEGMQAKCLWVLAQLTYRQSQEIKEITASI